ncbi:restriction endonuclease subunit S (plasmid) [Pediococcus pentosaceus]|uniref:restriction endonuclease subunit S n=1 Tax=Pediococcus pentosaceus TaxID=1255 RepID=UPI002B4BEDCE|nr:restriction endonuclease subunit S [Pediococcus pentosaceus]MEB3376753.1 restriction endonuclease subunit S [Pediococcus pentosaceus]
MSNKVPQLRFNGYSDAWVQRKLADLSDGFSYGLNAAAKEYDGVHGYLRITDIDEVSHSFLPEGLTSPNIPEDQLTDYRMDEQSIVYARTGASTGKTYIYRDSDGELYYAGFLIRQKVNKETSAQFVYQNTLTKAWERYVQVMSQRSGQPGINAQEVGRFELAIPERAEQDKIAHLFNSLDNLIAANQRKLDLLKEQKKGYLQKMFPKNGAKVPELRFAGFADDWEERKLGEHAKYRRGSFPQPYGNKEWYDGEGAMPFVQVVDVTNKLTLVENTKQKISKLAQSKSVFVPKGTVVVTLQGSIGRVAITQYDSFVDRTLLIFEDYEKETDERFWAYTIQKKFEIEKLKAPGGTIKTITKEALSSFDVHLPQFKEQAKIGSFFKQLDDTIALHQRKLDLLKEQKKGYLQKMFV